MNAGTNLDAYRLAQSSIVDMKCAIVQVLTGHTEGLRATDIARILGVNADFTEDQTGWYPWTVLKIMELERTVEQVKERGPWRLVDYTK